MSIGRIRPGRMNEKAGSYRSILRTSSIIGGSSFINIALGVLRTKVLAVLLGPAGVGLASLYTGLIATVSSFTTSGVGPVGTRQIAVAMGNNDTHAIMVVRRAMFWATLLLASASGLVVWALRSVLAVHTLGSASYTSAVGWLSIGVALTIAGTSQVALIQGLRRIGDVARINILSSILSTVLGILLLWRWGKAGLIAYILMLPVAGFLLGHIFVLRLPKFETEKIRWEEMAREWTMLLHLGSAMVGAAIVQSVSQLLIRIFVARSLGASSLGQYQAAWMISMQYVSFVLTAMATDYYPRLTGIIHDHQAASRLVNEQTEIALLLSSPIFVFMMAMSPWVIHLLYAPSFAPAAEILRWQVLGDVLKVAAWPMGFVILAVADGKTFLGSEVGAALILTTLVVGLEPTMGLRITGVAYLAMYAIYLPLMYWLARRRIGFRWTRSVFVFSIFTLALCAGVGLLAATVKWGMLAGLPLSAVLAVYSAGRIAHMSNMGGPLGKLGMLVRRFAIGAET